jgi:hypothetical protein
LNKKTDKFKGINFSGIKKLAELAEISVKRKLAEFFLI